MMDVVIAAFLTAVAPFATLGPALPATRVDPVSLLRNESRLRTTVRLWDVTSHSRTTLSYAHGQTERAIHWLLLGYDNSHCWHIACQ